MISYVIKVKYVYVITLNLFTDLLFEHNNFVLYNLLKLYYIFPLEMSVTFDPVTIVL